MTSNSRRPDFLIAGILPLRGIRLSVMRETLMAGSFLLAIVMSVATWLLAMRSGVRALEEMKN